MNVLNLKPLNGTVLKASDRTPIRVELSGLDADSSTATVRLYDEKIIYYQTDTVVEGNVVTFSITDDLLPGIYTLEVVVDQKHYFPSDNSTTLKIVGSTNQLAISKAKDYGLEALKEILGGGQQSGGIRTDVAYCNRIGQPLREIAFEQDDEITYIMKSKEFLSPSKNYYVKFEFRPEHDTYKKYPLPEIINENVFLTGLEKNTRDLVEINAEFVNGSEYVRIKTWSGELDDVYFANEHELAKATLYEVDLDAPKVYEGFATTKEPDDLSYRYLGLRQTTGDVSLDPRDYSWVDLGQEA